MVFPPVGGVGVTVIATVGVGVRSGFALEAYTGVADIANPLMSRMAMKSVRMMRMRIFFIDPSRHVVRWYFFRSTVVGIRIVYRVKAVARHSRVGVDLSLPDWIGTAPFSPSPYRTGVDQSD